MSHSSQTATMASSAIDRARYLNKRQLQDAGWTERLIRVYLHRYVQAYPLRHGRECLYEVEDVECALAEFDDLREKLERRLAKKDAARRKQRQRMSEIAREYPRLDLNAIREIARRDLRIYGPSEVGYVEGVATEAYWGQLGYETGWRGRCGYLVDGDQATPVYSSTGLDEVRSDAGAEDVWSSYCERCGSPQIALAELLKLVNRLQKVKHKHGVYALKDRWIHRNQDRLVCGRIARRENKDCWECYGSGQLRSGDTCWKCEGTGIYSSRCLYEHTFNVEGRRYCFHSYAEPTKLSDQPGADLDKYGHPFLASELPLPPQSVLIDALKLGLEKLGHWNPSTDKRLLRPPWMKAWWEY